jgi:hypothetical protein
MTDGPVSYRAIFNDENNSLNPSWGIYDGFTDEEKWQSISGGVELTNAGPGDISHVIASGPHSIEPNRVLTLGFALLAGIDLNDLQGNADSAKDLWQTLVATRVDDQKEIPVIARLGQNFPNPFNASTKISYQLPVSEDVELKIYDALGRKVRILILAKQTSGHHEIAWDGRDDFGMQVPSGTYFYRLKAGNYTQIRKAVLLK